MSLTIPDFSELEEMMRRRGLPGVSAGRLPTPNEAEAAPSSSEAMPSGMQPPSEVKPLMTPSIASPAGRPAVNLPAVESPQRLRDESELQRQLATGSGVSQIKSKPLRTLGRIGDIAASIFAPGTAALLPGTSLHHEMTLNQQRGNIAQDVSEEEHTAQAANQNAEAVTRLNPPAKPMTPKEEQWKVVPGVAGPGGKVLQEESTSGQLRWAQGIEGVTPLKEAAQQKPDSPEQQFIDEYQRIHKGSTIADAEAAYQKLAHPPADRSDRITARSDKSYQYNDSKLDKLGQPIEQVGMRIGRLQDTIAQNSPQADALVAPELLTVMAGGQGSGLRMNEAEISRVVGGRSNWESLKASANKWRLDPKEALSITPEQRQEIRALVSLVHGKLMQKQEVLNQGRERLLDSDDPKEHRRIVADIHQKLTAIDEGGSSGGGSRYQVGDHQYEIPEDKKAAFLKKHPDARQVQ